MQDTKLGFQKIAAASGKISTRQIGFWSRKSCYHSLFAFTAIRYWQYAKLRLTSSLVWSLAHGRQSRLTAISNICFFPVPLDGKSGGDWHSIDGSRRAKIGAGFSKDVFLIILSYWSNLCFLKIRVGVCNNDHIRKDGNNPGTGIANVDREGADDLCIGRADADGANNPGTGITDVGKDRADNLGIGTADTGRAKNLGTSTVNADRNGADNPSIGTASNAIHVSLFFLRRALFLMSFSSKLETMGCFLVS